MAVKDFTRKMDNAKPLRAVELYGSWATLGKGDTGDPILVPPGTRNIAYQAVGTFDSQTLTMQGSVDGTNYAALINTADGAATLTADGIAALKVIPRFVRPSLGGSGAGATVVVSIFML